MKTAPGIENPRTLGGGTAEFNRSFHAFAATTAKISLRQSTAGQTAQAFCQLSRQFRNVALQHCRTALVQFVFQRFYDGWVVVASVVDTITREKIENAPAVASKQLRADTTLILHVHIQNIQQMHPLRVDIFPIGTSSCAGFYGCCRPTRHMHEWMPSRA